MLVDIALESALSTPEQIRALRPVVPQQLMPDTRGMRQIPSIRDVLATDRFAPTYRSWVSGAPVMFRNGQMVDDSFSGSTRYSMQALGG